MGKHCAVNRDVSYYLSKGFDKATAEYFAGGQRRIVAVSANEDFSLTIDFDNGEKRILDVSSMLLKGTVFEKISDIDVFKRVYLDDQHVISWDIDPDVDSNVIFSNKIDLCPDTCYVESVPIDSKM